MRTRSAGLLVGIALVALAGVAHAQGREERARAHFEAGRVRYNLGDYAASVREFAAGYQLLPRPQFLVNLGQAYRRLGQLERAREMYQRFLADAPADDRARPQVIKLVAEVERAIARAAARAPREGPPEAQGAPPDEPDDSTLPPPEPSAAAPVAPPVLVLDSTAAAPSPRGFWRRHWWIIPVGAAVVTGLAVGIYFGTRPSGGPDCGGAEFGCLDLKR